MSRNKTIRVLVAFRPYLQMLQAYNYRNFWNISSSLKIKRIGYTIYIAIRATTVLLVIILGLWRLIENNIDMREFSTYFALLVVYTQLLFLYVVMVGKNTEINDEVKRVQRIIDKREFCE